MMVFGDNVDTRAPYGPWSSSPSTLPSEGDDHALSALYLMFPTACIASCDTRTITSSSSSSSPSSARDFGPGVLNLEKFGTFPAPTQFACSLALNFSHTTSLGGDNAVSGAMDLSVNDGDLTMRICATRVSPARPFSPRTGRFVPTTGVAHTKGESQTNRVPVPTLGLTSVDGDSDVGDRFGSMAESVGAGVFASTPVSFTRTRAGVAGDAGGTAFSSLRTVGANVTLLSGEGPVTSEEGPVTSESSSSDAVEDQLPSEAVDAALAAALTAANATVLLLLDDDDNGGDELLVTTRPSPPEACGRIGVFDTEPKDDRSSSSLLTRS